MEKDKAGKEAFRNAAAGKEEEEESTAARALAGW